MRYSPAARSLTAALCAVRVTASAAIICAIGQRSTGAQAARQVESPTIAELIAKRPGGDSQAWERLRRGHLPLIESVPGDSTFVLATFAWHGDSAAVRVILRSPFLAIDSSKAVMDRLPGTGIWYKTLRLRNDAAFSYAFIPAGRDRAEPAMSMIMVSGHIDPENPDVLDDGAGGRMSVLRLAHAPSDSSARWRPGIPAGHVIGDSIRSVALGATRAVWAYVPPASAVRPRDGFPVLILSDGRSYQSELVPTPIILDNLIAAGAIPPTVAIFIDSPSAVRTQDLRCNVAWERFITEEVLPWAVGKFGVTETARGRIIGGGSAGGLAALCTALRHPNVIGNVIAISSGIHLGPAGESEPEWVARYIAERPVLPVRLYLRVGLLETITNSATNWPSAWPTLLVAHRHLRTVLTAKGYQADYGEFYGGHELLTSRLLLPEALHSLLR